VASGLAGIPTPVEAKDAPARPAVFRQANDQVWLAADIQTLYPQAALISLGAYEKKGDLYECAAPGPFPKEVFIEREGDWVEPASMPVPTPERSLRPNETKLFEVVGTVEMKDPAGDATFVRVQEGARVPPGAILRTGTDGHVVAFLGGINSVRFAPGTEATLQQYLRLSLRKTVVDLKAGAVFSKVGRRPGVEQDFRVRTPSGVAAAKGTDFVTVQLPNRVDVWIAEGTVELSRPDGTPVGTVSSTGQDSLQIIRNPPAPDPQATAAANSLTMGAAIQLIPLVNKKVAALRERQASGQSLTEQELTYLSRIRKIQWYVRVEPARSSR
jgi:FecR protein